MLIFLTFSLVPPASRMAGNVDFPKGLQAFRITVFSPRSHRSGLSPDGALAGLGCKKYKDFQRFGIGFPGILVYPAGRLPRLAVRASAAGTENTRFSNDFQGFWITVYFCVFFWYGGAGLECRKCMIFHCFRVGSPRCPGRILTVRICCQKVWNRKPFWRDMANLRIIGNHWFRKFWRFVIVRFSKLL